MDFNKEDRSRIQVNTEKAPLYVTADPILVRIALRNLLENALRYSPAGTPVSISVHENDAELGVEFHVSNIEPVADAFPKDDVFARHVRGRSVEAAGSGMGLYITSEIAKLHGGWVRTEYGPNTRIFRFFLQD
jgi:signal transduction histidine kinase